MQVKLNDKLILKQQFASKENVFSFGWYIHSMVSAECLEHLCNKFFKSYNILDLYSA